MNRISINFMRLFVASWTLVIFLGLRSVAEERSNEISINQPVDEKEMEQIIMDRISAHVARDRAFALAIPLKSELNRQPDQSFDSLSPDVQDQLNQAFARAIPAMIQSNQEGTATEGRQVYEVTSPIYYSKPSSIADVLLGKVIDFVVEKASHKK